MSTEVKVVKDGLRNAGKILNELQNLLIQVSVCQMALIPFKEVPKSQAVTLPRYIAQTRAKLEAAQVNKFELNYPALSEMISNGINFAGQATGSASGDCDDGIRRLHDGIYKLGQLNKKLQAAKYIIKSDAEREELVALCKHIYADFVIFIITQYKLNAEGTVLLSVKEYCDREGISADIYYGQLLLQLEQTGESPYGYEPISPYRDQLVDIDAVFVSECEDNFFPLTDVMSRDIIEGKLTINDARLALMDYMKQSEQKEVSNLNPGNMIQQLDLS